MSNCCFCCFDNDDPSLAEAFSQLIETPKTSHKPTTRSDIYGRNYKLSEDSQESYSCVRCFQCKGAGALHDSTLPHLQEGCGYCQVCPGCNGSGLLAVNAKVCIECNGKGKIHKSSMAHVYKGCLWCKICESCQGKGWKDKF